MACRPEMAARYPVGSAVTVHYDPADPKTSALEITLEGMDDGWKRIGYTLLIGAAFFLALAIYHFI
jgi:Protein of unknown function (DUF3592)